MDGHNIGWAEFVSIELGLLFAVHKGFSDVHFLIKSDNQRVIGSCYSGRKVEKSLSECRPTKDYILTFTT